MPCIPVGAVVVVAVVFPAPSMTTSSHSGSSATGSVVAAAALGLSDAQTDLLLRLGTNYSTGLTRRQVQQIRNNSNSNDNNRINAVDPPIKCPGWVCCLLPCIKNLPSMKAYRAMAPGDCDVKRDGTWVRYDATALVVGDIIRIEAGDVVPADCVALKLIRSDGRDDDDGSEEEGDEEEMEPLLVDHRNVTGEESHRVAIITRRRRTVQESNGAAGAFATTSVATTTPTQLLWGGRVVQGRAVCVVTAIGSDTYAAALIREGKFPPVPQAATTRHHVEEGYEGRRTNQSSPVASMLPSSVVAASDEEEGVALLPIVVAHHPGSMAKQRSS